MRYYLSPNPPGPIARLLAGIVALLTLAGLMFFGLIALAIFVVVISTAFAVAYVRARWLGRKRGDGLAEKAAGAEQSAVSGQDAVIEAEYTVISRRRD